METLRISTASQHQVIDITVGIKTRLPEGSGVATIFVQHSTAAVTTANIDSGTDQDLLDFLASLAPERDWHHPREPAHAPAHLLASLIGSSVIVPYAYGQLLIGSWQRIVFIELDGPRERAAVITFIQ